MSIRAILNDSIDVIRTVFEQEDKLALTAGSLRATWLADRKVLVCGNEGNASDGARFATELACRFVSHQCPYPAISFAGDGSLMTAIRTGFLHGLANLEPLVPEQVTARIQEAHKVIIHLLCGLVEPDLSKE